ncbi:MAG: GMC family oxidoreductase [Planctomycetes bacterium]|nr:GMC family oxidoreductase [Planctomycetota bacterium]MCB9905562.1 GMC family oxidoreductase [Planctomycetota bacterium]
MLIDFDRDGLRAGQSYDLAIVGSGPAGATVAAELAGRGLRVCVLESGRAKRTAHADALKEVRSRGIHVKDYSRERVIGGASTTWAGLSSPLDAIDFEVREWVPDSGWPIGREDLDPYYRAAAERYRFPSAARFESGGFARLRVASTLQPSWERLEEKLFLAAEEPQNFGKEQRAVFEREDTDLLFDASVVELQHAAGRVTGARLKSSGGRDEIVEARAFVLATGGIENARILLLSNGLGNAHDQVGRRLMNHPKNYHGILRLARPVEELPYYFGCLCDGYAGYAGLRLREDEQREQRLLNSYVRFEPLFAWSDSEGVEAFVLIVKRSVFLLRFWKRRHREEVVHLRDYSETGDDSDLQNARKGLLGWLKLCWWVVRDAPAVGAYVYHRVAARAKTPVRRVRLRNFMEMQPDPENRVSLSDELDPHGRPLPLVSHAPSELDRRSLVELHEALADELRRAGIGELESDLEHAEPWPIDQDASHHIGTTRMGRQPERSVVDPDLRVHGTENLYCAGASVFPTSGCANPTFTIVALSIRLAEHLKTTLGAGGGA